MAARFLDLALDDVTKSRAVNNRSPASRRGGAVRGVGGNPAGPGRDSPSRSNRSSPYSRNANSNNNSNNNTAEDRWTHDKFNDLNQRASGGRGGQSTSRGAAPAGGSKIIVENLHYAVTLEDIKELFTTHAGPVKFAEVKYDPSGRSTGAATIVFKEAKDAAAALEKLNGIALDGQPMKIKFAPAPASNNRPQDRRPASTKDVGKRDVFSRLGASEADIASRLGKPNPLPKATGGAAGGRGQGASNNSNNGGRNSNNSSNNRQQAKPSQPKEKKKPHVKTAEELDAEMDTYMGDGTVV
ncbi:hypothetical protein BGZ95_007735 [Linnemannia exigua]|uniref:RRM domain-containing protein n=1 Tax=Linnemannia exigua TaxID=604196 RepID=A0AAD4H7P8_9FUNG|nr:hypothetical protein BGZ95_007735 [Linnemannia exigua]